MDQGIDTGSERTVQPTTTLGDEFGSFFGNIGFGLGGLDVGQMPLGASLCNQFETENTIFSQEHVLLENVHSLDTLLTQSCGKSVISVEILF
jgi:hypothetical protein